MENKQSGNIRFESRGDRTYAFRRRRHHIAGFPKTGTRDEYLGAVDPETGRIIPATRRDVREPNPFRNITTMDLGNILIMHSVACDLGLPDDLETVFGGDAPWILALAMAQAMKTTSTKRSLDTLSTTCAMEALGLTYTIDGDPPVCFSASVDQVESFYRLRTSRCRGSLLFGTHVPAIPDDPLRPHDDGEDAGHSFGSNVLVSMTKEGVPTGMLVLPGSPSNTTMMCRFVESYNAAYHGSTLILDHRFTLAGRLSGFLNTGIDVVTVCSISEPVVSEIASLLRDPDSSRDVVGTNGRRYNIVEGTVCIRDGVRGGHMRPEGHADGTHIMHAFPTMDVSINSLGMGALRSRLDEVRSELDGMCSEDPEKDFISSARDAAPFMRFRVGRDGTMHVASRRNRVTEFRHGFGASVILSSSGDWERSTHLISMSRDLVSDLGPPMDLLDDPRNTSGCSGEHRFDRMVRLVSAMILARIRTVLRENGITVPPRDALSIASTYRIINICGERCVTDPDEHTGILLKIFGVDM